MLNRTKLWRKWLHRNKEHFDQLHAAIKEMFNIAEDLDLSMVELSKVSGLSYITIWKLRNHPGCPQFLTVMKLAKGLNYRLVMTRDGVELHPNFPGEVVKFRRA